jgi:hypothetical protein
VDKHVIERCMDESGGLTGDNIYRLLERELEAQKEVKRRSISNLQEGLVVNRIHMNDWLDDITSESVFASICDSYAGSTPEICQRCAGHGDTVGCINGNPQTIFSKMFRSDYPLRGKLSLLNMRYRRRLLTCQF